MLKLLRSDIKEKIILEKIKYIKYQYLKKRYHKFLSKRPENCKYNKRIVLPNKSHINICSFNLEELTLVDLCYKIEHSRDCNAFCPSQTKEILKQSFLDDLKSVDKLAETYKDLYVLFGMYPNFYDEEVESQMVNT